MNLRRRLHAPRWTVAAPVLAVVVLALTWGTKDPSAPVVVVVGALLAAAVLAAVHHAEVVAHRVGEPFGSLVLAVAVTVIEVALIVTLMVAGGDDASTLARDTVFAAVMITCNGIVGLSLLTATLRHGTASFNAEGTATALATVATLTTLALVFPSSPRAAPARSSPRANWRSRQSPRSRSTRCSWSCRPSATATTSCPSAPWTRTTTPTRRPPARR